MHERITTTYAKALELRPWIEKLMLKAMQGDHQGHMFIKRTLFTKKSQYKLQKELAPRYLQEGPPAGFTRVEKIGPRKNDCAEMARIELVNNPYVIWEQRQEAKRADEVSTPSFWEWEYKLLLQEQSYFKAHLDKLQEKIEAEIAESVAELLTSETAADQQQSTAIREKVEAKHSAKKKFLL